MNAIGSVMDSHEMLHKIVQSYDLYLQGTVTETEFGELINHAEEILEHEDMAVSVVKHDHSILNVVDAEFEVMH